MNMCICNRRGCSVANELNSVMVHGVEFCNCRVKAMMKVV